MQDLFSLRGALKTPSGAPAPDLFVAIADVDLLDENDLIGLGMTDADGRFRLSFAGSEFRQDWFEDEATPDIHITVSTQIDGVQRAIFQKSLPNLTWHEGATDLGDIVLAGVSLEQPIGLEGVEPVPGHERRVMRLDIGDDTVRHCLAEVAPIVEHLTGWRDLLEGLNVEIADSLVPYMLRESLLAAGKDPSSFESKFTAYVANFLQGPGAGCALYDPHIHTLVINRSIMKHVGLEGLKIMCGHELVHVGQYKYTPGLKEYNLRHLQSLSVEDENLDMDEQRARTAYMLELEGYAKYIEEDYLHQQYYKMALLIYHASTVEKMLQAMMAMMAENVEENREAKTAQYVDGLEIYRSRAVGGVPARFQLDVSALPDGAACVAAAAAKG